VPAFWKVIGAALYLFEAVSRETFRDFICGITVEKLSYVSRETLVE
jgi:hypothetical protein